jgi:predicted phage terminase large subunit-like protein
MVEDSFDIRNAGSGLKRAIINAFIARDLFTFIRMAFDTVVPGEFLNPNWHIRAMAFALERVMRGEIRRLIITLPPRNLKSITASVAFPAYVLGHDPTKKIVCVSYSTELAVKHANDCRAVMRSPWYRRIFPETRLSAEKNTEIEIMTTQRGGRFTTSIGGTLTGRGGNIIIIDDPMKPADAMSEAVRKSTNHWFDTTLLSRLNLKTEDAIIVVMQRLHVDDLVGALLEKGGWEHLDLPAIAEEPQSVLVGSNRLYGRKVGDVLDPKREPRSILDEIKASMGSMDFSAQYQQRPIPAEGNLIRREWFRQYDEPPKLEPGDIIVVSWDTAMKATEISDYSVGTVWHFSRERCYLLDLVRGRYDYPTLKKITAKVRQQWPHATVLIEDKGSGTSLIQDLRSEGVSVINISPESDKVTRLFSTQALFEAGSVLFPSKAPWLADFISELLAFPNGRHDDQVDSLSQALRWYIERARRFGAVICMPIVVTIPRQDPFGYHY